MSVDTEDTSSALIRELLKGAWGDLLAFGTAAISPEAVASRTIDYLTRVTSAQRGVVVFRDGFRLASDGFPVDPGALNRRYRGPDSRENFGLLFDKLSVPAITDVSAGDKINGLLTSIVGQEVCELQGPLLVASMPAQHHEPIGLLVMVGEEGVAFTEEEREFFKAAAEMLALKIRALVAQYFGGRFSFKQIGFKRPFVEGQRPVVALFADIRNFTPLTSLFRGRVEITRGLESYFNDAAQCIFDHGGMLDKFMGDGVMAIFGALSNDREELSVSAKSACETARDLVGVFEAAKEEYFNPLLEERSEFIDLDLGVGIDAGEALLGFFGGDNLRSYSAIGDAINTAARLEGAAGKMRGDLTMGKDGGDTPLGNVLVGGAAYRLLPTDFRAQFFRIEPVDLRLKGKSLPVRSHEMKV